MELARHVGIEVPETQLVRIHDITGLPSGIEVAGDTAFAIKRFDRAPDGTRLHIEDFAQVFDVYPERKYERASYGSLARVLWIETGELGITEFIRRLVFTILIGNADMHLKNWSLIYPDGRTARLAPAYDFVATVAYLPEDKLALSLAGSKAFNTLTRGQFIRFAAKAKLPEKLILDTVEETVSRFREEWRASKDALSHKLRTTIDHHIKTISIW
jgi:serine/threonine-protein kinase HipA